MMNRNLTFKLIFMLFIGTFLKANTLIDNISQERLMNLKNADIVGISKGLPAGMLSSLSWEESRGYATAVGKNNTDEFCSFGLCQINETNEEELANRFLPGGYAIYDRFNPNHSAIIAAGYLLWLHKKFENWKEALCAYNWGPGNVERTQKYSDIPFKTREYARKILSRIVAKPHDYLEDIKNNVAYTTENRFNRISLITDQPKKYYFKNRSFKISIAT